MTREMKQSLLTLVPFAAITTFLVVLGLWSRGLA